MKIRVLESGFFKLDGGAMFGVVPKRLWAKMHAPDANNMCTWSMRCLLIEDGDRKIIIDTGIGDKQGEKFQSHFEPHGTIPFASSLSQLGIAIEEITDVFLTHLHFDHVGAAVRYNDKGQLVPSFPNATYWSNEVHYLWAMQPNAREKASFLKENFVPLQEHGQLKFIDWSKEDINWFPGFDIRFLDGHTRAMMMPILTIGGKKIYYGVDLVPSSFHLSMPFVMSYDVNPLGTLEEKAQLYENILEEDALLVFEHDPQTPAAKLRKNEKGRVVASDFISIEKYLSN